jgi:hypothetical protein
LQIDRRLDHHVPRGVIDYGTLLSGRLPMCSQRSTPLSVPLSLCSQRSTDDVAARCFVPNTGCLNGGIVPRVCFRFGSVLNLLVCFCLGSERLRVGDYALR